MAVPFNLPGGVFFDLSARTKLRVGGSDRLRFLNGQVTNDVRKGTPSSAIAACVLNGKGKLDAHVFFSVESDFFVIDAEPELRQTLPPRLQRYVIADDVAIEDVCDEQAIFHLITATPPTLPDCRVISVNRFSEPGWDVWVDSTRHDDLFQRLAATITFCDAKCAEVLRIERGIPRWGRELTAEIIPIEANLEASCIDYEKGCYIGQEIISRMKMSGQRNKKLCGLVGLENVPVVPQTRLISGESKDVGWITSGTYSERFAKQIALGYVKRGFNSAGTRLGLAEPLISPSSTISQVEIVDLPFTQDRFGI
jgi:folate-binding protein YgfZ